MLKLYFLTAFRSLLRNKSYSLLNIAGLALGIPLSAAFTMGRTYLELFLLTVASLQKEAYGATITQSIHKKTGRVVVLSAVHFALYRLKGKGLVTSALGGATLERGGRRKSLFAITAYSLSIKAEIRQVREELWQFIFKNIQLSSLRKSDRNPLTGTNAF